MVIRQEKKEEFREIYDLVKLAFETAHVSDGKEQDFVNQLRAEGNYIPRLALVAEEDGQLIGHIMLTRTWVKEGAKKHTVLLLAPLSVKLEYRNRGVGGALIRESFRVAKDMGYKAVFLVGAPAYYHRFGFQSAASFGIQHMTGVPDENVMACELEPGAFETIRGTVEI